ncbi:MAG: integrin alpha, partial [Nitrospiria bacterium]
CVSVSRPTPIFPLDRAAIRGGAAFTWQSPAALYRFQLANSPAFDGPSIVLNNGSVADTRYVMPSGLTGGVYYWRVGAVDACGTSYDFTRSVIIGSTTGDVTGDGYADVLVGAPGVDSSDLDAGAVYLYPGGSSAPLVPVAVLAGQTRGDLFGNAVAKAGDLDRDGYVDVLVGAYAWDRNGDAQERTGQAYLFWGGPSPATKPAVVFTGESPGANFGLDVNGVGDVNGDGYPDVAVGGYRTTVRAACSGGTSTLTAVGRVYVYFGGPRERIDGVPDVVLTGETLQDPTNPNSACREGDEFGGRLAGAGDVNGDGYDDIVVGARGYDFGDVSSPSMPNAGRAYIFYGGPWLIGVSAARADVILSGSAAGDEFGEAVAGLGDADGDGFADVLVGAPLRDGPAGADSGAISWYYGESSASDPPSLSAPISGLVAGDDFGFSVAGAGDVDADGLADVIVGAFLAGPGDNGSATVYGRSGLRSPSRLVTITGEVDPQTGDWFGGSVSGAGDVDGDGLDDVAAGAYRHDECSQTLRCEDAGRAYVFKGSTLTGGGTRGAGSVSSDWVFTGLRLNDSLGMRVD